MNFSHSKKEANQIAATALTIFLMLILCVPPTYAETPLRFWAVTGSVKDVEMYRKLAVDFKAKTGIDVDITPLGWGNFATKYFTAMAAGLPPDIGITNLGGPFDYGSVGGLVDLRAEFKGEIEPLEAQFNPNVLKMFSSEGKLYGLPSDLSTLALYYRTDIFGKLKILPPKTWSELNRVINVLEANGYRYYFGFTAEAQWADDLYTMPYDLPRFAIGSDRRPRVNWNDSQYQKGILQALRLWHMHNTPGRNLGARAIGMFRSDDPATAAPMMLDLHGVAGQISVTAPEIAGKWETVPWPKADDGHAHNVMGGTTYVIFRKSQKKAAAFQWLKYLNSTEAQEKMILDHAQRGEDSALSISPVLSVWTPDQDAFWNRPELSAQRGVHRVAALAMPTFSTSEGMQGAVEASRLEANLLDQMGTFVRDKMDVIATKNGLSRSQLVRKFAQEALEPDRLELEAVVAKQLKQEYSAITPKAEALLKEKSNHYRERYGNIIAQLPEYERRKNVLDGVKAGAAVLLIGMFATVMILPKCRKHLASYLFIAPPILLATIFVFIPAVTALFLSFTDYHPVLPLSTARWVGAQNYVSVATNGDLSSSIGRTVYYAAATLPAGIILSLVFAYLLNNGLKGERFWRFLYFSPLVTSVVSIALIFSQLFLSGANGWLNAPLLKLGFIRDPIPFLTSEHTFLNCVVLLAIWHGLAFTILIFLAGLQQIPTELYEAASVDGAGLLRQFWNIAVPGLRPQIFFVTIMGFIGAFQVFETIYTLAGKSGDAAARFGPNDSALTMVPLIYHTGFETFEMGRSAAIAYVLFAMILCLTVVQMAVYRRKGA